MRYLLPSSMAALVACGSCAHAPVAQERPDTASNVGVAQLVVRNLDGDEQGYCTAWKVGSDLIMTAGHCCAEDQTYILRGPNAVPGAEAFVLVDLKPDDDSGVWNTDVCVMRGMIKGAPIELAPQDAPVGAHVWTAGWPHREFLISEGIWAGRNDDNSGLCSVVARGGASGSPIMDSRNRAIGMLVAGFGDSDNMAFTATLENMRAALRKARKIKGIPGKPEDESED